MDPISEPDVDASWSAEIARRLVEIDTGTVELIKWDDVRSELFGELNGENEGI
ncbi:MAG TPA: addiction module protein [Pyrinomonadaceae bacterium]|nr:addiction module protein [Pyrinomonadaceae bacterium]